MTKLSEPSKELARRLLSEVDFEDRIVGVKIMWRAGNKVSSIYSFREAVDFLHTDSLEDLLSMGTRSSIGFIDPDKLKRWVSDVLGDKELAEEMGKEIEKHNNYADMAKVIKQLMQQRLSQCRRMVGNDAKA